MIFNGTAFHTAVLLHCKGDTHRISASVPRNTCPFLIVCDTSTACAAPSPRKRLAPHVARRSLGLYPLPSVVAVSLRSADATHRSGACATCSLSRCTRWIEGISHTHRPRHTCAPLMLHWFRACVSCVSLYTRTRTTQPRCLVTAATKNGVKCRVQKSGAPTFI